MASAELLLISRGLLDLTVGVYLLTFRPLDRRALFLALVALAIGLDSIFSPWTEGVVNVVFRVEAVFFLLFVGLFPERIRWPSLSAVAWIATVIHTAISIVYTLAGQVPTEAEDFGFIERLLSPASLGGSALLQLLFLARLRDLLRSTSPAAERHAAPYFYMLLTAGILTGGGFVLGNTIGGLLGRTDYPSMFYEAPGGGAWFLVFSALVWWVLPAAIAVLGFRLGWRVPLYLLAAGLLSFLPVLLQPDLPERDPDLILTLRLWGYLLGPAFIMYAQARWAPFAGEPTRMGWVVSGFAALFAYVFVFVAIYAMAPLTVALVVGPIAALAAALGIAFLVLPRARKLHLQRVFTLAANEPLAVGAVVLGRYRIERILGQGGQGRVYEATDRKRRDQRVVLKALAGEDAAREARILKDLDHPNIIRFVDVVEIPGFTLLVLEFAEGGSLRGLLSRHKGGLPASDAWPIIDGILSGLAESHARGVAHRDVKPENVLLANGVPKLADFGVAHEANPDSTLRALGRGTLAYLAPEQVRGEPGDARSDVYAAGVVLHELLTGKPPIALPSDDYLARQAILHRPPKVLLPGKKGVAKVVERALDKDPKARFRDAAEMRTRFKAAWSA